MAEDMKKEKKTVSVGDVLAKDKAPKSEAKNNKTSQKKKHKHTHIEHHYSEDGKPAGHTVRHTPQGGGEEVSYSAPDLDAVHDGLEQHVGEENADEGAAPEQAPQSNGAMPMAQPQPQAV